MFVIKLKNKHSNSVAPCKYDKYWILVWHNHYSNGKEKLMNIVFSLDIKKNKIGWLQIVPAYEFLFMDKKIKFTTYFVNMPSFLVSRTMQSSDSPILLIAPQTTYILEVSAARPVAGSTSAMTSCTEAWSLAWIRRLLAELKLKYLYLK